MIMKLIYIVIVAFIGGTAADNFKDRNFNVRFFPTEFPTRIDPPWSRDLVEKRSSFDGNTPTEKAAYYLEWFVKDLKEFIGENGFSFEKFEPKITEVRSDLARISYFIETESVNDTNVSQSFGFSKSMMDSMVGATERMKLYSKTESPGGFLVGQIFELRVRLLALYNSHGQPDTHKGYENKVFHLYCVFHAMEDEYKNVSQVALGIKTLYEKQAREAKKLVDELRTTAAVDQRGRECCPRF